MKVTQTVETKYNHVYIGYGFAELTLTDDNILDIYETIAYERERILKQRAEEAAHLASQTQENEDE